VEDRYERIVVETEHYRVTGSLRLPHDGYLSRLSDYLNAPERRFLPLIDVEISSIDGSTPARRREFVALSVSHIVVAMPAPGTRQDGQGA